MALCPQCGGEMRFDIPSQKLLCAFCDTSLDVYEQESQVASANAQSIVAPDHFTTTIFTCPQCGGEILSTTTTAAAFCSFCGASTVLKARLTSTARPTYIIPFHKTKQDCQQAVSKILRRAFFAPQTLRNLGKVDSFRGIYMPYWGYDVTTDGEFALEREDSYREGDYVITNYYQRSGTIKADYQWLFFDASSSFYDALSRHLSPFHSQGLQQFSPGFLSGFYGDISDIPHTVYQDDAHLTGHELSIELLKQQDFAKRYSVKSDSINKQDTRANGFMSAMLPVWFMAYRYENRIIYITINGQTGKVVADIPISKLKYFCGSLVLALPFYWLYERLMVLTPISLLQVIDALALFAIGMHYTQTKTITERSSNKNDKGLEYSRTQNVSAEPYAPSNDTDINAVNALWSGSAVLALPILVGLVWLFDDDYDIQFVLTCTMVLISAGAVIFGLIATASAKSAPQGSRHCFSLVFFVISALIALIIHLWGPIADSWYYGAGIIQLLAIGTLFTDIINQYNTLSTNPLPQFNRQGGDDNA